MGTRRAKRANWSILWFYGFLLRSCRLDCRRITPKLHTLRHTKRKKKKSLTILYDLSTFYSLVEDFDWFFGFYWSFLILWGCFFEKKFYCVFIFCFWNFWKIHEFEFVEVRISTAIKFDTSGRIYFLNKKN